MLGVEARAFRDIEKAGPPEQTIVRDVTDPTTLGIATNLLGIPLYGYNQVPSFLRGNPHITDGYRAHLSTELCVKRLEFLSMQKRAKFTRLRGCNSEGVEGLNTLCALALGSFIRLVRIVCSQTLPPCVQMLQLVYLDQRDAQHLVTRLRLSVFLLPFPGGQLLLPSKQWWNLERPFGLLFI